MWIGSILSIAAILRFYRITELTEFLGDQGRTMLVMYDFVYRGIIPLSGPTTLTGHSLGPFFYYLLLPGYFVSGGNPVIVSMWMAFLGVVSVGVLYELVRRIFGVWPARASSLLWAISPFIISSDRVIWEPNLVPLFSLLFLSLLYKAHQDMKPLNWAYVGAAVGILVQLHYPTIVFAGLTAVYIVGAVVIRRFTLKEALMASLWCIAGSVVVLAPFLWYEYLVGFTDVIGITNLFTSGIGPEVGKRIMLDLTLENSFRIFGRAIPFMSKQSVVVVALLWCVYFLRKPAKINLFLILWLGLGLFGMARFTGVVHDHYLFFLIPVPFLMIASIIDSVPNKKIALSVVILISLLQFAKTDMFNAGNNDIQRVQRAVGKLREEVGNEPFSFTLINSRSFSDLHYRYYMRLFGLAPSPITETEYKTLIIVCDGEKCPSVNELTSNQRLPILCFEPHCRDTYPTVSLEQDWSYEKDEKVERSGMLLGKYYVFRRKS